MRPFSLSAFPKSGVTYLSSLLFYVFFSGGNPSDIEKKYIIDIHINSLEGACSYIDHVFFKSHYPFDVKSPLCMDAHKAIYLIRDPIDIMNSTFDFLSLMGAKAKSLTHGEFLETWAASKGAVLEVAGAWPEHVTSWMEQTHVPVLLVRYQELVDFPERELSRILEFLELSSDAETIRRAVENSTMSAMRAREEDEFQARREGVFYSEAVHNGMAEGARFINKGYRRSYEALTDHQKKLVDEAFGEVRAKYLEQGEY